MSDQSSRRKLGVAVTIVFVVALIMGPGPGVMLVQETSFMGFPAVYAWGLFWYAVEVIAVVVAFFFVWKDEPDDGSSADSPS